MIESPENRNSGVFLWAIQMFQQSVNRRTISNSFKRLDDPSIEPMTVFLDPGQVWNCDWIVDVAESLRRADHASFPS